MFLFTPSCIGILTIVVTLICVVVKKKDYIVFLAQLNKSDTMNANSIKVRRSLYIQYASTDTITQTEIST